MVPAGSVTRKICSPMGTLYCNVSPLLVVPNVLSSKNQNNFASASAPNAINPIGSKSRSAVITIFVSGIGDTIIGASQSSFVSVALHPGINAGAVFRRIPARRNISIYSESQNSKISLCVVFELGVHARRPVLLSIAIERCTVFRVSGDLPGIK